MNIKKVWQKTPDYVKVTLLLTAVVAALLIIRNLWLKNDDFKMLRSNLLIGSLPPLLIAIFLQFFYKKLNAVLFWLVTLLWVLFYPNAPYMISDLTHTGLDPKDSATNHRIVYDTLVIFSAAMLSVYYGLLSLKIMFNIFRQKYSDRLAHVAIAVTIVLSCLGFYMGREMISEIKLGNGYLYSWEIFSEPGFIIKDVWNNLFPFSEHIDVYAMMGLFGVVQYLLLVMFKDIGDIEAEQLVSKNEDPVLAQS